MTAARITEKNLQQSIYDCARRLGWMAFHVYDARKSTPGFPDLLLLKPPRIIVAELKTEKGTITSAQYDWLEQFSAIPGVEWFVWRPTQWLSGEVEAILKEQPA